MIKTVKNVVPWKHVISETLMVKKLLQEIVTKRNCKNRSKRV